MRPDPVQDPMLVLCPIGQEGHVNGELLRDRGLPVRVIDGFAIPGGYAETGGLLVAEEAFDRFDPQPLFSWLETQPPWSDYPIILLRNRESSVTGQIEARFERLGNLTISPQPRLSSAGGAGHPVIYGGAGRAQERDLRSGRWGVAAATQPPPRWATAHGRPAPLAK